MKTRTRVLIGAAITIAVLAVAASVAFVMYLVDRPGPPPPAQVPVDWRAVRESPGHQLHLAADVRCHDCHLLDARFARPIGEACETCHPGTSDPLHLAGLGAKTPGCIDCHAFRANAAVAPWGCARCHLWEDPAVPQVLVHATQPCSTCHFAHQTPATLVVACARCHEGRAVEHARASDCTTCHAQHELAEGATERCASCHASEAPLVPVTAIFEGHDACVGCHRPHEVRSPVRACASCHGGMRTLAGGGGHRDCTGCHAQHDVTASIEARCEQCHDQIAVVHGTSVETTRCSSCHGIHGEPARLAAFGAIASTPITGRRACSSCHVEATSDRAYHVGGVACTACHRPHDFGVASGRIATCAECHAGPSAAAAATKGGGHARCAGCHTGAPHALGAAMPACATCHAAIASAAPRGHDRCETCHEPHGGRVDPRAACASCHDAQAASAHAARVPDGCLGCHHPHDAAGATQAPACTDCHTGRLPALHAVAEHRDCARCHDIHEAAPSADRATCTACHTAMVDHEPEATSCKGCHPFQ